MFFIEGSEHPSGPEFDLGFRVEKFSAMADVEARFAANRRIDELHRIERGKAAPERARNDVLYRSGHGIEFFSRAIDRAEGCSPRPLVVPKRDFSAQGSGAASVIQRDVQVGDFPG